MKLDRVVLENFGIYSRQSFDFDGAPLVLVYGSNESGKTTALNGLRQAMFGFPMKTPYLVGKTMAAEVHGTLMDGSAFQFSRKKGRKDEVAGKHGMRRLDAEDIPGLFGNVDLEMYQQLFGFTLEELRAGEASLKSAKLSEALAGGGMGGANLLQSLREDLQSSTIALYRARGGSQIATLLAEIRSRQEELKSLQVLPQAIEELRANIRSALERSEQAKSEIARLQLELVRTDKLKQALPKSQQLTRIDRALAEIEVPQGVDTTFIAQWSDYAQQLTNLTQTIQQQREQLTIETQRLSVLSASNLPVEQDARVESLGHQANEIGKLRKQLMDAKRQLDEASAAKVRSLEMLGIDAVDPSWLKIPISAPQRDELECWISDFGRLGEELVSVAAKLEAANEQLQQIESSRTSDAPENFNHLKELVAKLREQERSLDELVDSVCEKCESPEFEIQGARLQSRVSDCSSLDYSWPIPDGADVARFVRQFEEQERNRIQLQRDTQQLELEILNAERELQELQRADERSVWGELRGITADRDRLLKDWLDDLSEPLIACSITPDQQRLRIQNLQLLLQREDGLIEQIADSAEMLARVAQTQKQLAIMNDRLASLQNQAAQEQQRAEHLQSQWLEAWAGCPFTPLAPELMVSWVKDFESWSRVAAELDIERRKLTTHRASVRQIRDALMDQWPTIIDSEATWQSLQSQIEDWGQLLRSSEQHQGRAGLIAANLADLKQREQSAIASQREILSAYQSWLSERELPADWPLSKATVLVDCIDRLKRDSQTISRCELQIQEATRQITEFEEAVQSLSKASDESNLPPEALAQRWLSELQATRKDAAERAKLSASIEFRTARLTDMESRAADIEKRISALSSSVADAQGDLHRDAFHQLMQQAQRATELRVERSDALNAIEVLAGREPLENFLGALGEIDEGQLAIRTGELKRAIEQSESARQKADQDYGALTSRLEQLSKNDAAQQAQLRLKARQAELSELAEQWVVSRLAQELLDRCIDRFTQDNEPALLQLTHRFLSKLTAGRYTRVEHAADGGFSVCSDSGERHEPAKLSTGTREQLYLAIRMAFITHYAAAHEPLPILMDDCFVNFDDVRTRLAVQTLLEWNGSVQTILLSCHGRVVQQLAELAPETPVICLDRQITLAARDVLGELAITQ